MEETIMRGLCSMVLLLRLIVDGSLPEGVKHHQKHFEDMIKGYKTGLYSTKSTLSRGAHMSNGDGGWTIPEKGTTKLAPQAEEYVWLQGLRPDLLGRCEVIKCQKVLWQARTFRPSHTTTDADGIVRYRSSSKLAYGEITGIFAFYCLRAGKRHLEGLFMSIRSYEPLSDQEVEANPFKSYPDAGIHLLRSQLEDKLELVPVENILSHVVSCPIDLTPFGAPQLCMALIAVDEVSRLKFLIRTSRLTNHGRSNPGIDLIPQTSSTTAPRRRMSDMSLTHVITAKILLSA